MNRFKAFWLKLGKSFSRKVSIDWGEAPHNFTPRARKVLQLAKDYALSLHHPFVGTEHVLVGLIQLGDNGVAQGVLKRRGVQLRAACEAVEAIDGKGPPTPIKLMLPTPRLKRVFDLAKTEAEALGHTYIGTEHLLVAMMREGQGVGARALKQLNVDLDKIIQDVHREICPGTSSH